MTAALAFLFTPLGRWAAIAAMIVAAWFGFAKHYEKQGASRVVAQMEEKAKDNAKKADTVRRSVSKLPAGSLRDAYRRD